MLSHYLSTALRHFRQQKLITTINVVCLSLGFLGFLSAHWFVTRQMNADRNFPDAERIYAVTERVTLPGQEMTSPRMPMTGWTVGPHIRSDIPALEEVVRATVSEELPVKAGDHKAFLWVRYADPQFFDIFSLRFLAGDAGVALHQPRSAVITSAVATQLFGGPAQAIGSRLLIDNGQEVFVTGVVEGILTLSHMEASSNSNGRSFRFDVLASEDVYESSAARDPIAKYSLSSWESPTSMTYIKVPRGMSIQELNRQLQRVAERHGPRGATINELGAVQLSSIMMNMLNILVGTDRTGVSSVALLYAMGLLTLLVSCLNYVNLATAQATLQAKEIGLRRVVGARPAQVARQYLFEAAALTLIAVLLALCCGGILMYLARDAQTAFVATTVLSGARFWITLGATVALVSAVAGFYPAVTCAQMQPIAAIRADRRRGGRGWLSALFVGLQFAVASFLLVSILVMTTQNRAVERTVSLTAPEPTVVIANKVTAAGVRFDVLRTELLAQPHVRSVSASMFPPWSNSGFVAVSRTADETARRITINTSYVQYDYFATMGFRLLSGRVFERDRVDAGIVIDRAMLQQMGWSNPVDAVGQNVTMWQVPQPGKPAVAVATAVIGVVENKPLVLIGLGATSNMYMLTPDTATIPVIRIAPTNTQAALREIDAVWEKLAPNVPIRRHLVADLLTDAYKPFAVISGGFMFIAVLALVGATLGLIGMSLHVIGRRTHEIGVRKTLGASAVSILRLLLKDFSRPVLIANLVAWPLAFIAMQIYLSIFMQRVGLTWVPFVTSLAIALAIAWTAVIVQATRAARTNPAAVLRYE